MGGWGSVCPGRAGCRGAEGRDEGDGCGARKRQEGSIGCNGHHTEVVNGEKLGSGGSEGWLPSVRRGLAAPDRMRGEVGRRGDSGEGGRT